MSLLNETLPKTWKISASSVFPDGNFLGFRMTKMQCLGVFYHTAAETCLKPNGTKRRNFVTQQSFYLSAFGRNKFHALWTYWLKSLLCTIRKFLRAELGSVVVSCLGMFTVLFLSVIQARCLLTFVGGFHMSNSGDRGTSTKRHWEYTPRYGILRMTLFCSQWNELPHLAFLLGQLTFQQWQLSNLAGNFWKANSVANSVEAQPRQ